MPAVEQIGPYRLTVPEGVFPLGGDTLALGDFATVRPRWRVCDLGTGSGALLLLLARRERSLSLAGIELDEASARAAQDNLTQNDLAGTVVCGDLRNAPFQVGAFDLVISNPPYFPTGAGKSAGRARSEEDCTLADVCRAAARLLRAGGRFALCHRPERLCAVLDALRACGLEPKRLQLLAHDPAARPSALLIEAVRGGRPGLEFLPARFAAGGQIVTEK